MAHLPWLLSCLAPFLYPNIPPYPGATPPQKPIRVCPLVETGGEFGPTQVPKPFSLLELRQIEKDLGSYTDDPGKYINTFQHITLAFDLTSSGSGRTSNGRTSWSYLVKLYLTLIMLVS